MSVRTNSQGHLKFGFQGSSTIVNKLLKTSVGSVKRQGFTRNSIGSEYEERIKNPITGQKGKYKVQTKYRSSYVRQIMSAKYKSSYVRRVTGVVYSRGLPGGYRLGTLRVRKRS